MMPTAPFQLGWIGRVLRFLAIGLAFLANAETRPSLKKVDLFAQESWHNHGSCLVEAPDGQLFACWFHGSGERKADDVRIEAARLKRGSRIWSPRFTLADTPGYPDCNPSLHVDDRGRLWLFYPTILDHHWEGALLKYRVSSDWQANRPPRWERSEVLHVTPGTNFESTVAAMLPELEKRSISSTPPLKSVSEYLTAMRSQSTNLLYRRLGWMPRARPLAMGNRLVLGLYHDGFSFSLMAITDDDGNHWFTSMPLIGGGNIQPSLVQKRDGTLVAFMRDNGPPPKRIQKAESTDRGETWGLVTDTDIPNPGSGADLISLKDGSWVFIGNDTPYGRNRLAVYLSMDEGKTWPWRKALEDGGKKESFSYPSLIQSRNGTLHATYSAHLPTGNTIRHAAFNLDWLRQPDPLQESDRP